jgi:hypothetical protein
MEAVYQKPHFSHLLPNTLFTEEVTFITCCHIFKHNFIIEATTAFQKITFSFSLQRKMTGHDPKYQHVTSTVHNTGNYFCGTSFT